jgi:lysophospholipase
VPGPNGQSVAIHYGVFQVPNEKGAIVFLPGRTEPILKHAENILDLMKQGYSVYALDHRGQGASGRMTPDPQMGYVEYFKDYVTDVTTFVNTVVQPGSHRNLFLLAHSMGGGIAAQFVFENPDMFRAVALSSPMLGINTGAFPEAVAQELSDGVCTHTSQAMIFAIGQGDYDPTVQFTDTKNNDVTRSLARFNIKMQMFADNPSLQLGGVSYRWLCESLGQTQHLETLGTYSYTPTLLFQAGNDDIVTLPAEDKYCNDASACQPVKYADSYHEVLSERDSIRNDALAKTVRFFNHFATE